MTYNDDPPDVGFSREVAEDTGFYWNKEKGSSAFLADQEECLDAIMAEPLEGKSKQQIPDA